MPRLAISDARPPPGLPSVGQGLIESDPPASRCEALQADGWQAPCALHHVIGRDIDGIKLFRNRKDREDFLERLADLCKADALVRMWCALLL